MGHRPIRQELEAAAAAGLPIVPRGEPCARMLKIAQHLFTGGAISVAWLRRNFEVSIATAKRDMVLVERSLPCIRSEEPGNLIHGHAERNTVLRLTTKPACASEGECQWTPWCRLEGRCRKQCEGVPRETAPMEGGVPK